MKNAAMMVLLSSLTAGVAMAEDSYIPWTFDDFDNNCNVIDKNTPAASENNTDLRASEGEVNS